MKFIKNKDDYANMTKARAKTLTAAVTKRRTYAVTSYLNFIQIQQTSIPESG